MISHTPLASLGDDQSINNSPMTHLSKTDRNRLSAITHCSQPQHQNGKIRHWAVYTWHGLVNIILAGGDVILFTVHWQQDGCQLWGNCFVSRNWFWILDLWISETYLATRSGGQRTKPLDQDPPHPKTDQRGKIHHWADYSWNRRVDNNMCGGDMRTSLHSLVTG